MAESELARLPDRRPLPDRIVIDANVTEGLTPNELRAIKKASGLRLDYLMGDEADWDEKSQLGVFVALRRAGFDPTWDEAGDVRPVQTEATPDPTTGKP